MTQRETENQKVMIETLQSEMGAMTEASPTAWDAQRGYIPTCEYNNSQGSGNASDLTGHTEDEIIKLGFQHQEELGENNVV